MPATLHKLNLSPIKLQALPSNERYVFALTGHIFNELMALQKVVMASEPPENSHPFLQDAGVALALTWLRLLIGKTHEAMTCLSLASVQDVLRVKFFSLVQGLTERWDGALQKYRELTWLQTIRNSRAFHYMNHAQWSPDLQNHDCEGAYVIVGARHGDTLFYWSEIRAAIPMLKLVNEEQPFEGLATMLDELGGLLSLICECLAHGAQAFMLEKLMEGNALEPAAELLAPELESFNLPYFFSPKPPAVGVDVEHG
jgi:hypothetical protein